MKKLELNSKGLLKLFNSSNSKLFIQDAILVQHHLKGILERDDISSMAASVELRVPFLDHEWLNFQPQFQKNIK